MKNDEPCGPSILQPPWDPSHYALIDIGEGRRLERFGGYLVDRPCPAARCRKSDLVAWEKADAVYLRASGGQAGRWNFRREPPCPWTVSWNQVGLSLRCTSSGQVGIYPEHAAIWEWLRSSLERSASGRRILHLFAYTGGATLTAARCGAEVFHVDAARNVIRWARDNAALSGLSEAPIHWICEDARRFVEREVRRGRKYHGIILDPPTFGHGPQGERWQIDRDLGELLEMCARLLEAEGEFLVLTAHATGYTPKKLEELTAAFLLRLGKGHVWCGRMSLCSVSGKELPAGVFLIWKRGEP